MGGCQDGTYTIDSSKTKEEIEAKIDQLKRSALQRLDAALMNAHEARVGRAENDNQKWCLDLSEKGAGTYKVSIKNKDVFSEAGKLDIKINADTQAVILSVDDSLISENGILDFASYNINEQGCASYNTGKLDGDKSAKAIIWDFRNSKLKTINIGTSSGNWINGSSNGIFIAPNADINLNSTSSGWVICKDMHVEYGEWHNIDQSDTLAPEDSTTTPGDDNTGGKGGSEMVKPGDEGKSEDKPNTPKPNAGESSKPSDSGKTDTPSVENPSGHNEKENTGGSSTEIKNTDKPSETGNNKPEEEKPSGDNKEEAPKTDNTTGKETKPEDNEKQNEHKQNVIEESDKTNPSSTATTNSNGGTEENGSTVSNTSEKSQTNNSTSKGEETSKSSTHKKDSKHTDKGKNSDVNKEKTSKNEINNKNANPREHVHNSNNNVGENVNASSKAHGSVTSTVAEGGKEAGYNALAKESTGNVAAASDSEVSSAETVPKTGDHSNLLLYGGLFAASAAALALALLKAKKSK